MNEDFLINIDQLRKSGTLSLNLTLPSTFLELEENELHFGKEVVLQGEAYVVDERLVLHLDILVPALLPCTICSDDTPVNVKVDNLYHVEEIAQLKTPIFDFSPVLRQEILLEVPKYAECHDGNCPERENISRFLKKD